MHAGLTYAVGIACVALTLALAWILQLRSHNANLVDSIWAWGLGGLGIFLAASGNAPVLLRAMLAVCAGLWGARLGLHLYIRNRGEPEDGRYARFRKRWGAGADRKLFWLFQFQACVTAVLSSSFVVVAWRDDLPPGWAIGAAGLVWMVSVAGETLADAQLARFKQDERNRGRVCREGLWRYSRHPNYFFECLHWVTYLLLAVGSPWWWAGLIAPASMALLLLRFSGIPMTEAHLARTRPGYAEYMRTTSAFIPWPPKPMAEHR